MMVYLTGDGLIKDIHKQRKWIKQAQFGRKTDGGGGGVGWGGGGGVWPSASM